MTALLAINHNYDLIKELRLLRKEIHCLQERERAVKEELVKTLDKNKADCICNEDGTVLAIYKVYSQNRFDTESFKDSYPDIYSLYSKSIEIKRLILKE